MARKHSGGSVAVELEPATHDWQDVTAAVEAAVVKKTRECIAADLTRWRELILSMADGKTSADAVVGELTDLAIRLRLPSSAIGEDVAVVHRVRDNEKLLAELRVQSDEGQKAAFAAKEEIPKLNARIRECQLAIQAAEGKSRNAAEAMHTIDSDRMKTPRIFGDIEAYATDLANKAEQAKGGRRSINVITSSTL